MVLALSTGNIGSEKSAHRVGKAVQWISVVGSRIGKLADVVVLDIGSKSDWYHYSR